MSGLIEITETDSLRF